jgi:acetamidase/formamidase
MTGKVHELGSEHVHTRWRADLDAALEIDSGDIVHMQCREGFDGQVDPPVEAPDLDARLYEVIDFRRVAPVTGPVAIRGAEPGDTLEVSILDLVPFGTGNLVVFPAWLEADFLTREQREHFPAAWIRHFDMDAAAREGAVEFRPNIRVPIRPMLGVVGTAPAQGEYTVTGAPRHFGGNMDVRDVTIGSRVYLPVLKAGAFFSAGDGHAMQGDGEICTTGLETPMRVRLQFHLHKKRSISRPQLETRDEFMTIAHGRTLDAAARQAIGDMIDYLSRRQELAPQEAYGLLSLAADIRINQVVDFPYVGARVALRKNVFKQWRW